MKYPIINSKGKLVKHGRRRFTADEIKKSFDAVRSANYVIRLIHIGKEENEQSQITEHCNTSIQ